MRYVPREPEIRDEWNALVRSSPDGYFTALYEWQDMILGVPRWSLEEHSFAVAQGGQLVAVVPVQFMSGSRTIACSGFGWSGPVVANELTSKLAKRVLFASHERLFELAERLNARCINMAYSPLNQRSLANRWGVNPLTQYGYRDVSTQSRILDLSPVEGDLFSGVSELARRSIRKATTTGYTVSQVPWSESLDDYYRLHLETYQRTGATPHPREYFEGIASTMSTAGHAILRVGKSPDGKIVAFRNDGRFNRTGYFWSGCCADEHLDSGVNYLLTWDAITGAKQEGCDWYEIGEVFPGSGNEKERGLTAYKTKFGGESHRFFRGTTLPDDTLNNFSNPFSLWMLASAAICRDRFGEKGAARIGRFVRSTENLVSSTRTFCRMGATVIRRMGRSDVQFLKPYWSDDEYDVLSRASHLDAEKEEEALESAFRSRLDLNPDAAVVFTSSGRSALELFLRTISQKYPDRRRVLIPSYSCRGLLDPIVNAGLTPAFVDITGDLLADKKQVRSLLDESVLAFVAVHLCGKQLLRDDLSKIARRTGVMVIDDNCHYLGGPANSIEPDASIYSFGIGKSAMASAGGALVSVAHADEIRITAAGLSRDDTEMAAQRFRFYRHEFFERYLTAPKPHKIDRSLATQYAVQRMSVFDIAVMRVQMKKLDTIIESRQRHAEVLREIMGQRRDLFSTPDREGHVCTVLSVILKDATLRNQFRAHMNKRGIGLEGMYVPLHLRDCGASFSDVPLPRTRMIWQRAINVPVRPNLTAEELDRIADGIQTFCRSM